MRTLLILSLFTFLGMQKSEAQQKRDYNCCFELYAEKLFDKDVSVEGVVKYFEKYGAYGIEVKKDKMWSKKAHLFCPPLKDEYCKAGLKVKVKGKRYIGVVKAPFPNMSDKPKGGVLIPICRFRKYTITKMK